MCRRRVVAGPLSIHPARPNRAAGLAKDKAVPIIVVCQNGQRSSKAQAALKEAGYSEVYALEGGMAAWQQAGMPVVKQGVAK